MIMLTEKKKKRKALKQQKSFCFNFSFSILVRAHEASLRRRLWERVGMGNGRMWRLENVNSFSADLCISVFLVAIASEKHLRPKATTLDPALHLLISCANSRVCTNTSARRNARCKICVVFISACAKHKVGDVVDDINDPITARERFEWKCVEKFSRDFSNGLAANFLADDTILSRERPIRLHRANGWKNIFPIIRFFALCRSAGEWARRRSAAQRAKAIGTLFVVSLVLFACLVVGL